MGQKMKNAPVYFTIAQVRYNPVLSLESYIRNIQDSLRKMGYPDFTKGVTLAFNLASISSANTAPEQQPTVERVERYVFSNMARTRGFVLEQNALSYQATDYETFELFAEELLKGLEILHSAVSLDYSERVGVRYLDAVIPRDGDKLYEYLVPEVHGVSSRLRGVELQHSFSETTVTIPSVGNVTARTIIQSGQPGFPPDLQPIGLTLPDRFGQFKGLHAIIDTDGSVEAREPVDLRNLKARLFALHDEISKAFKATATPHAFEIWK